MSAKHTPTPWVAYRQPDAVMVGLSALNGRVIGGVFDVVWSTQAKGVSEVTEANATFLMRAVNAHDDLVAMLTEAAIQIEYMQEKFAKTGTGEAVASRCRQLLASLEAQS